MIVDDRSVRYQGRDIRDPELRITDDMHGRIEILGDFDPSAVASVSLFLP